MNSNTCKILKNVATLEINEKIINYFITNNYFEFSVFDYYFMNKPDCIFIYDYKLPHLHNNVTTIILNIIDILYTSNVYLDIILLYKLKYGLDIKISYIKLSKIIKQIKEQELSFEPDEYYIKI